MNAFDFSQIQEVRLSAGNHANPQDGMCFMEMTAWFAGEPHSDRPECACPVLGRYGMTLNDAMPDNMRDRLLKPLVPLIAGTRGSPQDELDRAKFLAMWGINRIAPVWLRAYQIPEFDALASQCEAARSDDELREISALAALAARAALAALAALAARAARAALVREQCLELMVEGLREAMRIGPHVGFDQAIDLTERHQALKTLVAA